MIDERAKDSEWVREDGKWEVRKVGKTESPEVWEDGGGLYYVCGEF